MNQIKFVNTIILLIGISLCSIPWVLGWGFGKNDVNVIMWNFLTVGGTIIMTAIFNLRKYQMWPSWISLYMSGWLMLSPLFLAYYENTFLTELSIALGIFIAILSYFSVQGMRNKFKSLHHQKKTSRNIINHNKTL